MSLQFQPTLISVVGAFQKQGLSSNSYYAADTFFAALDRMCGFQYDRTVAEQLFEQCQVNYQKQTSLEDFCQVIIDADSILKRKLSQTEEQIRQYTSERCKMQNNEILFIKQENQILNSYGVEKDSILSILIHNAQNIVSRDDYQSSYIAIAVGNYQHESNPPQVGDKFNPLYDQQFQLEEVEISLFLIGRTQQQKYLAGSAQLELGDLHDQNVHEISLQLKDLRGNITGTTIHIEVQWMYNKVQYYQDLIGKYKENIDQLNLDYEDFKRDLSTIQMPFNQAQGLIQSLRPQVQTPPGQSLFTPQQTTPKIQTSGVSPLVADSQRYQPPRGIQLSAVSVQDANQQFTEELKIGLLLMLTMGILSLFESFTRTEYVDFILFILLVMIIILDHFNTQYIMIVGILNLISIVYDVVWIAYYKHEWSTTNKTNPTISTRGIVAVKMTLVFCFFNLICKSILCYILYQYYKLSQTQIEAVKLQIGKFEFTVGVNRFNLFKVEQQMPFTKELPQ